MADSGATGTDLTDDEKVAVLTVYFWKEFERGANMNVDPDCIFEAIAKGAQTNIRAHINDLYKIPDGPDFLKAMDCCYRTGKEAASKATGGSISRQVYGGAYDHISEVTKKAFARKNTDSAPLEILAKICS